MQGFSHGLVVPDPRTGWPAPEIIPSGIACGPGTIPTWLPSPDRYVVSVTKASACDDGVSPAVTKLLVVCFPESFFVPIQFPRLSSCLPRSCTTLTDWARIGFRPKNLFVILRNFLRRFCSGHADAAVNLIISSYRSGITAGSFVHRLWGNSLFGIALLKNQKDQP